MRTVRRVAESPQVTVQVVECTDHHVGWSSAEVATAAEIVLVRRGRFQFRSRGQRVTVDPTSGYLQLPGHEARYAHPAGGDVCTSITLPAGTSTADAMIRGTDATRPPAVRVDARLEMAHRTLLSACADPDFAAIEAALGLLQLALRHQPDETPAPGRYDLADRAREAILADDPASTSLVALARLLTTSPSHLSRTFRHHSGMSLSRYRNRVRISRALQRLADGEVDIADLAITLGFSDQAHFTRIMRQELGETPRQVRSLLTPLPTAPVTHR